MISQLNPDISDKQVAHLVQRMADKAAAHPGLSGFLPLTDPHDAFASRLLLTQAAQHRLDVQYYIWRRDITGLIMLDALYQAAERGVSVRLLLDDNGTRKLDLELAVLNTHPNIQVRLFNPFYQRRAKWLGFLTDFRRLNHRMHNKSFTADGLMTLIGGRNMGDEYFGASKAFLFADLDVLAAGPVAGNISQDVDRYWDSPAACPVERLIRVPSDHQRERVLTALRNVRNTPAASRYCQSIVDSSLIMALLQGHTELEWTKIRMLSDDPDKALGEVCQEDLLIHQLLERMGRPRQQLSLISPYFVPTRHGVEEFARLARDGVDIHVLTNSLSATDVTAAHAGYAKRRHALLKAGIKLHEMRRLTPRLKGRKRRAGLFGSSGSSLHAKTIAVDDRELFIGSFNFDPRSAHLNTELGFLIESPALVREIHRIFQEQVSRYSFTPGLTAEQRLHWQERRDRLVLLHKREPYAPWWRRSLSAMLSRLPIEWML